MHRDKLCLNALIVEKENKNKLIDRFFLNESVSTNASVIFLLLINDSFILYVTVKE